METYKAADIAQWFINRAAMDVDMFYGEYVTNLKLQKLLYFAQGLSYAIYNRPLFKEPIQAWTHGPVVSGIYKKYKEQCAKPIEDVNPVEIDDEIGALLEFVFKKYGKYTASELRNMSHNQMPYAKNYVEGKKNIIIPNKEIKEEFSKNKESLIKEFNKNKQELTDYAETCYINSVPDLKKKTVSKEEDLVEVDWENEL